jgi:group II intron reverse transcriptase/maturase
MVKGHKPYSLGSMVRETEAMKPADKACERRVSKSAGCNESEPTCSLVTVRCGGRAFLSGAKTASLTGEVTTGSQGHHRGSKGDTLRKRRWETWETLPCQLSFEWECKTESYKEEPKRMRVGEGVGAVHSSKDYRDSITLYSEGAAVQPVPAEQGRTSDCRKAINGHINVRELQRRLYLKSKQERRYRYYSLYDKVYHKDVLMEAWRRVRKNRGAAGVDGEGVKEIEREIGVEGFLEGIQEELKKGVYRAQSIRRVYIPKSNGGKRPLGIPTVRDRVVQMAVKMVIEPIFEADFSEVSYGFRPRRSAQKAVEVVRKLIAFGKKKVVDIDIARYFDTIPHDRLMKKVAERIADKNILKLIKMWLKAGVMEDGKVTDSEIGTPQGGVISPLLANIYLDQLDKKWEEEGLERKIEAHLVRYADDVIAVSRHSEKWIYLKLKAILEEELRLKVNEEKSKIVDTEKESAGFLGFEIRRVRSKEGGRMFGMCHPCKKAMKRAYDKVREIAEPRKPVKVEKVVRRLNRLLRGWVNYFRIGNASRWFSKLKKYVEEKVRRFIRRKRNKTGYGWEHISMKYLYEDLGLYNDYRLSWRRA